MIVPASVALPKQQLLHQFLEENQEPFRLKSFIAHKRSLFFNNGATAVGSPERPPQVVVLHVPSAMAAVLLEAAVRIQKQSTTMKTSTSNSASGVAYLFTKLWNRTAKRKNRHLHCGNAGKISGTDRFSFTRRQSGADASLDSPESGSGALPEPVSHANSPVHRLQQGLEEKDPREEGKEQSSPVSILEPPFLEDDRHGSSDATEEEEEEGSPGDHAYVNLERAKRELLDRIERFEKLAELDPVELEKRYSDELGCSKPGRLGWCSRVRKNADWKAVEGMVRLDELGRYEYEEMVEEIAREIEFAIHGEELLLDEWV